MGLIGKFKIFICYPQRIRFFSFIAMNRKIQPPLPRVNHKVFKNCKSVKDQIIDTFTQTLAIPLLPLQHVLLHFLNLHLASQLGKVQKWQSINTLPLDLPFLPCICLGRRGGCYNALGSSEKCTSEEWVSEMKWGFPLFFRAVILQFFL